MKSNLDSLFLNSQLYNDYLTELANPQIEVVSFDVFDTLLRRTCIKPENVFYEVAKRAIKNSVLPAIVSKDDYYNIRVCAEKKARELSLDEDIKFDDIFSQMYFNSKVRAKLKTLELEIEEELLFADPIAIKLLQLANDSGKKIIITSDMYLPEEIIKKLVYKNIPNNIHISHFFVSSATKKTKTTGSQFSYIFDQLDIKAEALLHIGDNAQADVASANNCGINTLLFNTPDWILDIFKRESIFKVNLDFNIYYARLFSALLIPKNLTESENFFYYYGCVVNGPTLAGFAKWISQYANLIGQHEVFCLMREGDIYEECLKQIDSNLLTTKFYASRKSTYLASLNEDTYLANLIPSLAKNSYTLSDLYLDFSLGDIPLNLQQFKNTELYKLESISLGEKLVIEYVNTELDKHKVKIIKKINENKSILNKYFNQVKKSDLPYFFVDFGAGATIQHQLHLALDNKATCNLLFYANNRAYKKTALHHIASFIPLNHNTQKAINDMQRSPEILETVLVGQEQTTTTYRYGAEGKVLPVKPNKSYSSQHINKICAFNIGVKNYITVSQHLNCQEHTENNRESFAFLFERLINLPTKEEAINLGALTHEDNYGSDREYSIIEPKHLNNIAAGSIEDYWRQHCVNPSKHLYDTPWPQGAMTLVDSNALADFYKLTYYANRHYYSINLIMNNLQSVPTKRGIIIYGAGEFFNELEPILSAAGIKIAYVIDKRASFGSFDVRGYKVIHIGQLDTSINMPIVIASKAFLTEIRSTIKHRLGENALIISC
ncbi:hypothetical protein [Shewanella aestuarii]|uniref:HAD-IA family hydrolase n=1 Tax=Shewanella aestuarii TaxID=1028752 RepID=A0A6G9QIQ6_9GAMM|nr:hypothetical protein [Shewanella aestuarii]QIR13947.1 hypothetical protein HBH39_05075 [Shewanella aestuarii]